MQNRMIAESRLESIAREAHRHRAAIDAQICRRLAASLASLPREQIAASFEPWLAEAHRTLLDSGWAVERDGSVTIRAVPASLSQLAAEWEQAQAVWLADPNVRASVQLVDRCLTALPDILTGRRKAPEVIFPGSTLALVEGIYKNNPVADFFNEVLSETCVRVLRARLQHDPKVRVRILEAGAGTGGTSAALLQHLAPYQEHIEEYLYTDVSKSFLAHAQEHYAGGYPFLRTALFNVEQPAAAQGLAPASFDFVIASNVLHATRNVARTLRNIKYTLRANGVLLLNELTRKSLVTHVTFGLLDGWWLVEDAEIRSTGSPSLTLDRWRAVLQQEGYRSLFTPVAAVEAALGQQIIAAESDGVVRLQTPASDHAIEQALQAPASAAGERSAPSSTTGDTPAVHSAAVDYVLNALSGALKLHVEQIDPAEPLGNYGVDSILIGQLTHRLQRDFAHVTATIFFENQTADQLAAHLAAAYPTELKRALQVEHEPRLVAEAVVVSQPKPVRIARNEYQSGGIAIIGLSGRYPQAACVSEFWRNLKAGRDCITEIPADRWSLEGFYEPDPETAVASGRSYSKWGGFLDHVRGFDPMFFNISPREAVGMDPQERLFLTSCWELLEDAGYTRATLADKYQSRIGVFAGTTKTGFELFGPPLWARGEKLYPRTSFSAVANRVSYFLDLRGPSMAIDTMCSSSLVAIHEACLHLRQGACRLAIAGGVNVYLHPSSYVGLSAARMLSKDGRCRSFGAEANGFVPGEGVGAVLLKPLEEAVADGDRIYAVITASSVNHGGRTNGFTVPNPNAQASLIREAMEQAGVKATDIGYMESHGTGTDLGDPIEIAGLSAAFRQDTPAAGYCRIGSVKSNIGHLEAAAGIAGLTKILLQFKAGLLIPSLHADELNPNVRFEESPFIVQRQLEDWTAARRIAGISSFGAGGSNAHLIIEEYVDVAPRSPRGPASPAPFVVVLSARTKPQLDRMAVNLRAHLDNAETELREPGGESFLSDLAYTLQIGREALDERLGLVVADVSELRQGLSAYLDGQKAWPRLFSGRIKRHWERNGTFASKEDLERAITEWIAAKDYGQVIEAWVRGAVVDWHKLYSPDQTPRRIGLPSYPFATDECWFAPHTEAAKSQIVTVQGSESFLADHVIGHRKILPAVMYLELARAALRQAPGAADDAIVEIKNVVWSTPIEVDANAKSIHIALSQATAERTDWEFHTYAGSGDRTVHAQGSVEVVRRAQPRLDLVGLRAHMTRGVISGEQCYQAFSRLGIEYGPAHRGISRIEAGEGQVLAEIDLSALVTKDDRSYVLHPGVMDSALQSCIGLDAAIAADVTDFSALRGAMPFALRELSIYAPCAGRMWAWVRIASEPGANVRKLDIDVCDSQGRVAVQLRGYATRTIDSAAVQTEDDVGAALLFAQWLPVASPAKLEPSISVADSYVVLCGHNESFDQSALEEHLQGAHCVSIPLHGERLEDQFTQCSVQLFSLIRQIRGTSQRPVSLQVVIPDDMQHLPLMGLSALLATATLEGRDILGQMILAPRDSSSAALADQLTAARATPSIRWLRYERDQRFSLHWQQLPPVGAPSAPLWRHNGVYLITGGRGQVAQAVVDAIMQVCPSARIVLCGRTAVAPRLADRSPRVTYRPADVARFEDVESLIRTIVAEHGALHGIIHAAGIHRDRSIENKTVEEWLQVLAPKVSGAGNLDRATAGMPLDFFALWSSGAAVFGHAGQADYATANAFMDQFAQWRNALARSGRRTGHTLSLNWPQWQAGGMTLSTAARTRLVEQFELRPLSTEAALAAFYRGTHAMQSQLLVATGRVDRILGALNGATGVALAPANSAAPSNPSESRERVDADPSQARAVLRQSIAAILHLSPADIQNDVEFAELGFDSVLLTELAQSLNRQLSLNLDPTVFFDHPVLEDFANHLAPLTRETYGAVATKPLVEARPGADAQGNSQSPPAAQKRTDDAAWREPRAQEPIAIIGMSAEFPMAPDIDAFWANLLAGRDCIAEIPAERWSWQALFGDPQVEDHKTNVKWGGFIDGAACFDPLFFSISPREAELMDPQQRLLMTHAYWAIEEAGYDPDSLSASNTGIFVGTGNSGYGALAAKAGYPVNAYSATSVIPSVGPNRMSFFLNLHGPSVPIETACSSALVAIHEAVRAIRSGRCDVALAGGVMTLVTPDGHISFSKAGMLSVDGRCKAFSAQANGYVRGEGVGMLMLKPLSEALAEGAHIHGVIRGTSVNHGGRASSLTAPNPKAQAALLEMAYADAGIDPRTVSYIETHGTGTPLGDPIEINALKSAFNSLRERAEASSTGPAPQCGLGSVKSNIGHLEMAAGVAGVIKVLLQFKHRTLVSTLHCEQRNPYIDLSDTPFYLVTANSPWPALVGTQAEVVPRRAGVSSFGFGGVNAHVVLEEHVSRDEDIHNVSMQEPQSTLVPLSARTEEQLLQAARNVLAVLDRAAEADESTGAARAGISLDDLAFTLQVGRAALEQRLAIVARSLGDLKEKLQAYIGGATVASDVFIGKPSGDPEAVAPFHEDEELLQAVEGWFCRRKLSRLAALWVRGARLDWRKLHEDRRPRRISLPGYPFARDKYWIADAARINSSVPAPAVSGLAAGVHGNPFSHVNTSDLNGLRFTVAFSGAEPFLRDHVVRGQQVLPGVVHLEMMRAALAEASGIAATGSSVQLQNIVWARQLVVPSESRTVHVRVSPQSGALRCEVVSAAAGDSLIYAQCLAQNMPAARAETIDLTSLQARLSDEAMDGDACYRRFAASGLDYGPTHRAIASIRRGSNEALAQLRLPAAAAADRHRFVLHPSMMDAALQAAIGLSGEDAATWVPFSVERITVFAACTERMWAWVRRSAAAHILDIDLCDEQGRVCAAIRRLTCKAIADGTEAGKVAARVHEAPDPVARSSDSLQLSWRLTGQEYFVADHMKVVPGVALLEMVRAALVNSGAHVPAQASVEFENVVWPEPAVVAQGPIELNLTLTKAATHAAFEITTTASRLMLHAQGRCVSGHEKPQEPEVILDLAALQARCSKTLDAAAIRRLLIDAPHGPSMLPLERLDIGANEAFGTLRLPAGANPLSPEVAFHPSMMHGVFLAATLFSLVSRGDGQVELPFSLESLRALAPLPELAYVHVSRFSHSDRKASIQVADPSGRVCMVIKGFTTVAVKRANKAPQEKLIEELKETVAALAKIPAARIDSSVELSRYGLDSLGLTELTNALNKRYNLSLMPTLFFEHPTLASLARHLSASHADQLQRPDEAPALPAVAISQKAIEPRGAASTEPLAVVGMSGRLPGARDLKEFWAHLQVNADLIVPIPQSRWQQHSDREAGQARANAAGFMADADCFDSLFFGISPREAEAMDPQQRLFLEAVWACMEDAGYASGELSGSSTGVFVGASTSDYRDLCLTQATGADLAGTDLAGGATFHFEIANRVSYTLNLHGPSEVIDTACSSSLIALHRAIQSIRAGDCTAAFVGGVNLIANPRLMMDMSRAGMLSADGRCKTFDRRADGYGRGEGVCAILIKPLSVAQANGDHIYGLIRGSAVNHGGRASSPTAPNPVAQKNLLLAAYTKAGVAPSTVSYIETHGTGTPLGDPIEINGLKDAFAELYAAFGERPATTAHCALGSVKTNIGHLEAAAGISAVIKVLLMLRHGRIPGNGHLVATNPYVQLENSPFYLARQTTAWSGVPGSNGPIRRAGVSSFGVGGSNAHVIFEAWPEEESLDAFSEAAAGPALVPLSAKSPERLRAYAHSLWRFFQVSSHELPSLQSIARTLQTGRDGMACRVAFVTRNRDELIDQLARYASGSAYVEGCWQGQVGNVQMPAGLQDEAQSSSLDLPSLESLAQRYVQGEPVDWDRLYGGRPPRRISLPCYPFARVRHWLPAVPGTQRVDFGVATASSDLVLAVPTWQSLARRLPSTSVEPGLSHFVILCNTRGITPAQIERQLSANTCLSIETHEARSNARFTSVALRMFEIVQDLLRHKVASNRLLVQVVATESEDDPGLAALAALLKSAHQENPAFVGQLVLVAPDDGAETVARKLDDCRGRANEATVRYLGEQPQARRWIELSVQSLPVLSPWKSGGSYLITGGMGGLGQILAREILDQAPSASVILAGRSRLNEARSAELVRLQARGSVSYEQVDVCDERQVESLIQRIVSRHGCLQGIAHVAGLHSDGFISNKSTDQFRRVLGPKVDGTVHLDRATRPLDLDFFILFSSGSGMAGNAGQADYAAANAFMDEYARYRDRLVARGLCRGKTVSLNWSLWADGGMQIDAAKREWLQEHLGITPIDTASALQALYQSLGTAQPQVLVVAGDRAKIRARVLGNDVHSNEPSATAEPDSASRGLVPKVRAKLQSAVADLLKVPEAALAPDDPLDGFGLDSMMVTRLTSRLRDELGDIPRTLFYEQRTLAEIAERLASLDADACRRWVAPFVAAEASVVAAAETAAKDPVAIIGMSGRYATAANLDELWERLHSGESCITEIPAARWPLEGFYHSSPEDAVRLGKSYGKWGGFLEDFAAFDPLFFNISAKDAAAISPQERLFLEACWQALEDAAHCPSRFSAEQRERVGVYGAVTKTQANTSFAALVNRVSFFMNFQGPSIAVDTKCSSALVALHQACEALNRGEIDLAIVGAVNLYLEPETYVELAQTRLLADTPDVALFSPSGRGFVPSEGVGAVVLKRVSDAERNGDGVLALVRGTAVNHNGRTLSFGVPDPQRQAAVVRQAWQSAQIDPHSISYIESSANGSEIGDAIEITALTQAFGESLEARDTPIHIGSLKSALGHAEAASGMAQLTKVVLQIHRGVICPTVLPVVDERGQAIEAETGRFQLQRAACKWNGDAPLRAGIHSVGAGGVNAHAIIEEYVGGSPAPLPSGENTKPAVFVVSAKTQTALSAYLQNWHRYLVDHQDIDPSRLAYTLQRGREAMPYRFACVAASIPELIATIAAAMSGKADARYRMGMKGTVFAGPAPGEGLWRIAGQWLASEEIDWTRLYENAVPRAINGLPTYPFTRKTYWRTAEVHEAEPAPDAAPAPSEDKNNSAAVSPDELAVRQSVRAVIDALLEFESDDEISVNHNFAEMGFDSVSIVRFVEALNAAFGITLEVTAPFNYPSIKDLAAHIAARARAEQKASALDLESVLAHLAQDDMDVEEAMSLLDQMA